MGIMMAFTSVKPVVSHWAVAASTLISVMTEGSAGADDGLVEDGDERAHLKAARS